MPRHSGRSHAGEVPPPSASGAVSRAVTQLSWVIHGCCAIAITPLVTVALDRPPVCHPRSLAAVGGEDVAVSAEIDSGPGHQSGQPRDEVQRLEDDMGGAVTVGGLEPVTDVSACSEREALLRNRWAADVAAQSFALLALLRSRRHASSSLNRTSGQF